MKKIYLFLMLIAFAGMQACKSDKKADVAATDIANDTLPPNSATKSQIDALPEMKTENTAGTPASTPADAIVYKMANASVSWIGSKGSLKTQTGTISGKSGQIAFKDGQIVSGNVEIDMNKINVTSLAGSDKKDLEDHLKADDFFDVAKYPTAKFEIVRIEPLDSRASREANLASLVKNTHMMVGNLTIKDVTRSITVPVNIHLAAERIKVATSMFTIERSLWGVKYDLGTVSGKIKEAIVDDKISLQLTFEGMRAAK